MGQDQVACFSSYFRVYSTILTLFVVTVSSFLIHSIFSEQIMMVNLLPGLHLLYTELFITSLLLPLSVVIFILSSKRRHLLQCIKGKFPMVEVIGLVVNLLCIAALVAGTVLAWSAATTIDRTYQVSVVTTFILLPTFSGTGQLFLLWGSAPTPRLHLAAH